MCRKTYAPTVVGIPRIIATGVQRFAVLVYSGIVNIIIVSIRGSTYRVYKVVYYLGGHSFTMGIPGIN